MPDFEVFKPPHQLLRLLVQLAQLGMPHLVDAFHLPDHQFGIANHLERFDLVFRRIAKRGEQSLILGVVVRVVTEIFAEFGDRVAGGILDGYAVTARPGLPRAPPST